MHEEVGARGDPSHIIEREPATRHDHMHVRMMGECRAPRVQHGRDTDPRAEALGIGCDSERLELYHRAIARLLANMLALADRSALVSWAAENQPSALP